MYFKMTTVKNQQLWELQGPSWWAKIEEIANSGFITHLSCFGFCLLN